MLRIDINLLFTIINLLVLFIAMKVFLFKPVLKIIAERQAEADKQFADADARMKEADDLKAECAQALADAKAEKKQTLEEAKKNASEEYDKILEQARKDAAEVKQQAITDANAQKAKILSKAEQEVADLVVEAATKVVASQSGAAVDSDLYNKFLSKAGDQA